ncbi:MAG: hypothetical protein ACJ74U_03870 [Jatrophihabitantaceae bacterium]
MKYLIMIYSNPVTWAHPTFLHQREHARCGGVEIRPVVEPSEIAI